MTSGSSMPPGLTLNSDSLGLRIIFLVGLQEGVPCLCLDGRNGILDQILQAELKGRVGPGKDVHARIWEDLRSGVPTTAKLRPASPAGWVKGILAHHPPPCDPPQEPASPTRDPRDAVCREVEVFSS
jgi:hypothetical protein